jgi:phosphoribosyl 1,2-cyclic phosphate phosphodiesterase
VRLRFLGSGTSFGVPVIGCECPVCSSGDERNRRTRHSLAVEQDGRVLLVDTAPELRLQLLRAGTKRVDAVFLTHLHADHVQGIDDLRIFSQRDGEALPMYVAHEHAAELRDRFPYIFDASIQPNPGSSKPEIDLRTFRTGEQLDIAGFQLTPLPFPHGNINSYGFRAGRLGVVVDGKRIGEPERQILDGVDVLVINALWWGDPHPTHFNVEEALEAAGVIGAKRTFLTHLTHRLDYQGTLERLPPGVEPAYDGLVVEV